VTFWTIIKSMFIWIYVQLNVSLHDFPQKNVNLKVIYITVHSKSFSTKYCAEHNVFHLHFMVFKIILHGYSSKSLRSMLFKTIQRSCAKTFNISQGLQQTFSEEQEIEKNWKAVRTLTFFCSLVQITQWAMNNRN